MALRPIALKPQLRALWDCIDEILEGGAEGVGAQGPQGEPGEPGQDGAPGPAGNDGADGGIGPQGPAGADGADGATGPQGPAGPQGATGPQGPAGNDGEQGEDGPAGSQGPAGNTGPQGDTGPAGPSVWGGITGTLSTQADLQTALNGKQPLAAVLTNTTASFTTAQETKLSGIATAATANSPDATLLARANHTGSQAQSTVTNLTSDLALKAPLASPTFTGTVAGITKAMVGLGSAEDKSSATIRGEITSGNVTSALTYTPTSVTGLTGTQSVAAFKTGISLVKGDVGLGNADNTADTAKPVSTAQQTALDLKANLASPTFTGTVGAAAVAATGAVTSSGGGVGYATGAGGTVTQATNKSTAVTLNKLTGDITMNAAALAAGAIATFVLNNSQVAAGDMLATSHHSGGTIGPYLINGRVTGNGACSIAVRNTSAGSLSDAVVIKFAVIKTVTA